MITSTYAGLPEHFFARQGPTPVAKPRLIQFNRPLAAELGLGVEGLDDDALAALFSGNVTPPGTDPIALAYAGHQFGQFVPQLGDGRAILIGEARDAAGVRRDIQLKGAGRTPYSRNGDGRAAVGPVLREYLVSEAMKALGVPTTRALAAVITGETVYRDQALPGAILTRVAASHVRVGTFEYFAARGDVDAIRRLADYIIDRHFPELRGTESGAAEPAGAGDARAGAPTSATGHMPPDAAARGYPALLGAVIERQAALVAQWMHIGFIHGVMNTDNMTLSGETIDFGPCAFLDAYDPAAVFSSIDGFGRYAYANQPHAAQWNLARLAEALLPILDPVADRAVDLANAALAAFPARFADLWLAGMRRKLGLFTTADGDLALAQSLLETMHRNQADFTLTFRRLCDAAAADDAQVRPLFQNPAGYDEWAVAWRARLAQETVAPLVRAAAMRAVNPAFIPRNHRIQQVIDAAILRDDYSVFAELLEVLSRPYEHRPRFAAYADPPQPHERVLRTFCGT